MVSCCAVGPSPREGRRRPSAPSSGQSSPFSGMTRLADRTSPKPAVLHRGPANRTTLLGTFARACPKATIGRASQGEGEEPRDPKGSKDSSEVHDLNHPTLLSEGQPAGLGPGRTGASSRLREAATTPGRWTRGPLARRARPDEGSTPILEARRSIHWPSGSAGASPLRHERPDRSWLPDTRPEDRRGPSPTKTGNPMSRGLALDPGAHRPEASLQRPSSGAARSCRPRGSTVTRTGPAKGVRRLQV